MQSISVRKPGPLLAPPQTKKLRAGLTVLKPGQSVGEHTTGKHEEILVMLSGTALLTANGKRKILRAELVAYNPPHTNHNVTNIGRSAAKYVFIVS